MNIKFFKAAIMGLALSATAITANAQKKYTEGVVNLSITYQGNKAQAKNYFRADSNAYSFTAGPATIKVLKDVESKYLAVLVDVPVAGKKYAAVATPDEVEQAANSMPSLTFTPTTETKQISGFNCKKVLAKDTKTGKVYDVWVTNDVSIPVGSVPRNYDAIGGFPIQYTAFQQGQASDVTVLNIIEQKVPRGTFGIPADFEKVSLEDLKSMGGGR